MVINRQELYGIRNISHLLQNRLYLAQEFEYIKFQDKYKKNQLKMCEKRDYIKLQRSSQTLQLKTGKNSKQY